MPFESFQRKWRAILGDSIIAGVFYTESVKNEIFATLRTLVVASGVPTNDLIRLERTALDTYRLSVFPGRSDRGLTIDVSGSNVTITSISSPLVLASGNSTLNVPTAVVFPGGSACRVGPDVNNAMGTVTFGASATAPSTDVATGTVELRGQTARATAVTNLTGGTVLIRAGNGASSSAGAAHGGNVRIGAGTKYGTGTAGAVQLGYDGTGVSRVTVRNTILALNGYTTTAAAATTTELPTAGDYGIHKNSTSGDVHLCFNDGGTIKSVQLV